MEMIEKYFTVTSNYVELRINRVRINHSQPVQCNQKSHNSLSLTSTCVNAR